MNYPTAILLKDGRVIVPQRCPAGVYTSYGARHDTGYIPPGPTCFHDVFNGTDWILVRCDSVLAVHVSDEPIPDPDGLSHVEFTNI